MINALPIIGWMLSVFCAISMAIPFYFIWNRLAPTYFYWLPKIYLDLPFWHCVGLFVGCSILKAVLIPSMSQTNNNK